MNVNYFIASPIFHKEGTFGRLLETTFPLVLSSRLMSIGNRSFAGAAPRIGNTLPDDITTSLSFSVFHHKLKTFLFQKSYPDIILQSVLL